MSKQLLYLFGEPGTGKITVARILQERLGWRLFWLHDLDSVCAIVGRYPLPRLMDRISLAVLEELFNGGENVIYVRPSRDMLTVTRVLDLANERGYTSYPVRLWAEYRTLVERVTERSKGFGVREKFRATSKDDLDRYLNARSASSLCLKNAKLVITDKKTPEQVADEIQRLLEMGEHHERDCSSVGT